MWEDFLVVPVRFRGRCFFLPSVFLRFISLVCHPVILLNARGSKEAFSLCSVLGKDGFCKLVNDIFSSVIKYFMFSVVDGNWPFFSLLFLFYKKHLTVYGICLAINFLFQSIFITILQCSFVVVLCTTSSDHKQHSKVFVYCTRYIKILKYIYIYFFHLGHFH